MDELRKTAIIHIGAGKTGTTAIQNCLSANAALLKQNGVLFPRDEYFLKGPAQAGQEGSPISCGNGIQLFYFLTDCADKPWFDKDKFLDTLGTTLSEPYRVFIFSCEIIQHGQSARFALLRQFCDARNTKLKIVYCVRDFASHAFSSWRQLVTYNSESIDWPQFQLKYAREPTLSGFELTLRKLQEAISLDDIIVLNYSTLSHHITRRFFEIFGENYDKYQPAANVNVSDGDLIVDTMLQFNQIFGRSIDPNHRRKIAFAFYVAIRKLNDRETTRRSKVLLSQREYDVFRASLQTQLDYVNGNFLADDPIVAARPDQIGETGRPSDTRLAARIARKTAASLADEVPSLRIFRPLPVNLVRRFGRLISERSVGRKLR